MEEKSNVNSAVTTVINNSEIFNFVLNNVTSYSDLKSLSQTCRDLNYSINTANYNGSKKLLDYIFKIAVTDTNSKQQLILDTKLQNIFLNEESIQKAFEYLKNISVDILREYDTINICIEDRRKNITKDETEKYGKEVGLLLNKIFNFFDNAFVLNFVDIKEKRCSALQIYTLQYLKSSSIRKILGINCSAVKDYLLSEELNEINLFEHIEKLDEIGFYLAPGKDNYYLNKVDKFLSKLNTSKNLTINLNKINSTVSCRVVRSIITTAACKNWKIKANLSSNFDSGIRLNRGFSEKETANSVFKSVVGIKVVFDDLYKLKRIIKKFENLASLTVMIKNDYEYDEIIQGKSSPRVKNNNQNFQKFFNEVNTSEKYDKSFSEKKQRVKFALKTIKKIKTLKEFCIVSYESVRKIPYSSLINECSSLLVNEIVKRLPESISIFTLCAKFEVDKNFVTLLNSVLPNLNTLVLRKVFFDDDQCLQDFTNLKFLYLSCVPPTQIPKNLKYFLVEVAQNKLKSAGLNEEDNNLWKLDDDSFYELPNHVYINREEENHYHKYFRNLNGMVFSQERLQKLQEDILW
uniref:F-box domain-containing protein n=1 Tax=Parastrongyloides trichosuri TaxID=131310 RepID=A0A0N4ZHM4_PARTI